MGKQKVRRELSRKNPYHISKNRHLELLYFCLQYPDWKREIQEIRYSKSPTDEWSDPTGEEAVRRVILQGKIDAVEQTARLAGDDIYEYILKAVTEGLSFNTLSVIYDMPCGHDYYYERLHRFWYILSQKEQVFL